MKRTILIASILLGLSAPASYAQTSEWHYLDGRPYIPKNDTVAIEFASASTSSKPESAAPGDMISVNSPEDRIHLYPNPSKGTFYIDRVKGGEMILVFDKNDRLVYSAEISGDKYYVDISSRGKGMYTYHITDQGNLVQKGRIVIE